MTPRILAFVVLPMLLLASNDAMNSAWPSRTATDRAWERHVERESQWRGRQLWLRELRDAPLAPPPSAEKPAPAR